MLLTILEAQVSPERVGDLEAAYRGAGTDLPARLVRSELLRSTTDATRWRIQTLWKSRAALDAMRGAGTPAGVLMFRAAGAEPTLPIFDVAAEITPRIEKARG